MLQQMDLCGGREPYSSAGTQGGGGSVRVHRAPDGWNVQHSSLGTMWIVLLHVLKSLFILLLLRCGRLLLFVELIRLCRGLNSQCSLALLTWTCTTEVLLMARAIVEGADVVSSGDPDDQASVKSLEQVTVQAQTSVGRR